MAEEIDLINRDPNGINGHLGVSKLILNIHFYITNHIFKNYFSLTNL